jgi:3-deoxy-D-manno-octulosonic acid kinase
LSPENLSPEVERRVISTFEQIHEKGVWHGDVRKENILIGSDGKVWIIDFELSRWFGDTSVAESDFASERNAVRETLEMVRQEKRDSITAKRVINEISHVGECHLLSE